MTDKRCARWSRGETEELLRLLANGYRIKRIAEELGRSEGSVRGRHNYLRLAGEINFPTPGVAFNLTNEQKEEAFSLRKEQGLSYGRIAEIVGCSERTAARVFKEHGKNKPTPDVTTLNWTKKEDGKLCRLVNSGLSNGEISKLMGRSIYAIKKRRNDLKINNRSKYRPIFKSTGNPWLDIAG